MKKIYYLPIAVTLLLASCTKNEPFLQTIAVDFSEIEEIEILPDKIINLETNDSSLIYDIYNLETTDLSYIIHSRNLLKQFDKTGHFEKDFAARGNAPGEYGSIGTGSLFQTEDAIGFYDNDLRTLHTYSYDGGNAADSRINVSGDIPIPFAFLPIDENKYLARNNYMGEDFPVPVFSVWNNKLEYQYDIKGRNVASGTRLPDFWCLDKKDVLYWEPVKDTVFLVTDSLIQAKYILDFGEKAIPVEISSLDDYGRLEALSHQENYKYAAMRCLQAYNDDLFFMVMTDSSCYICKYEKRKKSTKLFNIIDKTGKHKCESFMKIDNDLMYISIKDCENHETNSSLYICPMNVFN